MTIWKFTLALTEKQRVNMPSDARILAAQEQGGDVLIWAMVNPENPPTRRCIRIIGTGWDFEPSGVYIGTVQAAHFVWHVYDEGDETES